jgi:1,4-dihydroxy-2-naphthoyl-CoA hydrolase
MSDADVERANALCAGTFPELIGLRFTEVTASLVRARLPVRPELFAPNGYLHGSVVTALAETACGFGTAVSRPEELRSRFATIELACNFLGTARDGWIACEATCTHAGRTTQVWDARVWREDDERQIALFRLTQLLLSE